MAVIPYSKPGTAPRKKRRESPGAAVNACYRHIKGRFSVTPADLSECAKKRNGPWSKKIYTRAESQWVQRAWTAAERAVAMHRRKAGVVQRATDWREWRRRGYQGEEPLIDRKIHKSNKR